MNDLPELLDHYFSLGVAEGNEGRDHDTNDGDAQATRDLIDQKIQRLQREVEEAKEFRAILEGHLSAAIDDYNEARKAAFIEAAEIAQNITSAECREIISEEKWVDMTDDYGEHIGQMKQGACFRLNFRKGIATALRAKAEGENHG